MGRSKKPKEEELEKTVRSFHYRCDTDDSVDVAFTKIDDACKKPVKKIDPYYRIVVATEVKHDGSNPHIHAKIDTNMSSQTLRARLLLIYPCSGNANYSLSNEKKTTNLSYVIKGGVYRFSPEMAEDIAKAPKWIPKDENEDKFDKELDTLNARYMETSMSDYEYVYKILDLYAVHKKHIYIAHIRAKWLGVANQRNKALDTSFAWRVGGNSRPFRHRLVEEIMRGFFIYDN